MIIWRFSVAAFLKKIVDYSHGFSSVFFQKTLTKSHDYSRLFSLKSFLRPPKVTKIVIPKVLQNFEKTTKCTCWFKELNQKGFPRNIQYRTRPKGPPFRLFSALCDFCSNFFPPKGPPSIFLEFCYRMEVEKSQRNLPFSFFGIVRLCFKNFSS